MQLTKAAWDYFNGGLYTEAISKTQECIALFKDQALREQQKLTASSIAAPPVGLVSDEKTKTEILTRGILNDVAACYYVMGQTLEKLERIDEAKEAYQHVQEFPDARVLGQDGYFWSPAQTASDRLTELP